MVGPAADAAFMRRALFVAERGRGRTAPNPAVGAVVVTPDGVVAGQGAHLKAGGPHAEVVALEAAGRLARGATLYCTLEPCSHHGRTGPCVERIAAAGVVRVVGAMRDPNPKVRGAGFAYLRAHGVEVTEGVEEAAARRAHEAFVSWVTRARPFVMIKAAVSADGYVGREGERCRLTGPAADRYFHRQRAEIDAIAVGARTVLTDDPLLTARLVFRERPLIRVLFDWGLTVPPTARVFSTLPEGPVIMVTSRLAAAARQSDLGALERRGATVVAFESRDVGRVLTFLAGLDVQSLLIEGGPRLQSAFFEAGAVDRVQWIMTPHVLGRGIAVATGPGRNLTWAPAAVTVLGQDVLVEFDVHGSGGSDRAA